VGSSSRDNELEQMIAHDLSIKTRSITPRDSPSPPVGLNLRLWCLDSLRNDGDDGSDISQLPSAADRRRATVLPLMSAATIQGRLPEELIVEWLIRWDSSAHARAVQAARTTISQNSVNDHSQRRHDGTPPHPVEVSPDTQSPPRLKWFLPLDRTLFHSSTLVPISLRMSRDSLV